MPPPVSEWKRNVTGYKPACIRHPEFEIGGQTARVMGVNILYPHPP